jgi:hypothetical protein
VRTPDLEDVLEGFGLVLEGLVEPSESGVQPIGDLLGGCDVHGSGERVIRGLAEIDVIVWVNGAFRSEGGA